MIDIDLCVIFSGVIAEPLARVFFWSLKRTTDLEGVTLHLVNAGIPNDELLRIQSMAFAGSHIYYRPSIPDAILQRGDELVRADTEWSCEWTMRNCGVNNHVVLSHFDVMFTRDYLSRLRRRVTKRTGMLGHHCPVLLLSRRAFAQSTTKFRAIGPLKVAPSEIGGYHLYHPADPQSTDNAIQVGFDTGELMRLELRCLGWDCDAERHKFGQHEDFYHFVGGGRVCGGDELVSIRSRAEHIIQEQGIQ
jgi:hypothetical protein